MMENDKMLEELFENYSPELNDNSLFMTQLTKKLDAVEYVKKVQEARIRRYRLAVVIAFVCGVVVGAALIALIMMMPKDTALFHFGIDQQPLHFIEQNSRTIILAVLSLIMSTGLIGILKTFVNDPLKSQKPFELVQH